MISLLVVFGTHPMEITEGKYDFERLSGKRLLQSLRHFKYRKFFSVHCDMPDKC